VELSWSTFVLEIINFVVLVWILKRFLYRPVLDVIAQRRSAIEDRLDEARRLNEEARALKDQYGGRLAAWEEERRKAKDSLAEELEGERSRRLKALEAALEQEKRRAEIMQERKAAEQLRAAELEALQQAATFSSRLLAQASGPDLEARLVRLLVRELDELSEEQLVNLREQWGEPPSAIEVTTAFELGQDDRRRLESSLRKISGLDVPMHFSRDEQLLAGVHVVIGAWVLAANVRDELKGFSEPPLG
jgi:F-type H+-transporting ATPase subunit b